MPVNIERESEESEDHSMLVDETKTLLKERPKRISFSKLSPVVTPEDTKGEFPMGKK